MRSEIIHYGMLTTLWRFFPRKVTIQQFTPGTQDGYGEKTVGTWTTIVGLEDLPCQVSPADGGEERKGNMTPVIYTHRIVISGFYPEIQENYRAVVDSAVNFDIVKIEHDSLQKTTPIMARIVTN